MTDEHYPGPSEDLTTSFDQNPVERYHEMVSMYDTRGMVSSNVIPSRGFLDVPQYHSVFPGWAHHMDPYQTGEPRPAYPESPTFNLGGGYHGVPHPIPRAQLVGSDEDPVEVRAQELMACIQPSQHSDEQRHMINQMLGAILSGVVKEVVLFGSVPLKTYLPDGDIDVTVLFDVGTEEEAQFRLEDVFHVLKRREQMSQAAAAAAAAAATMVPPPGPPPQPHPLHGAPIIGRDVQMMRHNMNRMPHQHHHMHHHHHHSTSLDELEEKLPPPIHRARSSESRGDHHHHPNTYLSDVSPPLESASAPPSIFPSPTLIPVPAPPPPPIPLPVGDQTQPTAIALPPSSMTLGSTPKSNGPIPQPTPQQFEIKDVLFIDAEVNLVKCTINGVMVDITAHQSGGVSTLFFLEAVDKCVGQGHLFKRSVLIVKAFCFYEAHILGSHHGLISTYALTTMVLWVINAFHKELSTPLEVLAKFLEYFSEFDWENFGISVRGPFPLASLPEIAAVVPPECSPLLLTEQFFEEIKHHKGTRTTAATTNTSSIPSAFPALRQFVVKHLNIMDPLRDYNNLGRSVSKTNCSRIRRAIKRARDTLTEIRNMSSPSFLQSSYAKYQHQLLQRHQQQQQQIDALARRRSEDSNNSGGTNPSIQAVGGSIPPLDMQVVNLQQRSGAQRSPTAQTLRDLDCAVLVSKHSKLLLYKFFKNTWRRYGEGKLLPCDVLPNSLIPSAHEQQPPPYSISPHHGQNIYYSHSHISPYMAPQSVSPLGFIVAPDQPHYGYAHQPSPTAQSSQPSSYPPPPPPVSAQLAPIPVPPNLMSSVVGTERSTAPRTLGHHVPQPQLQPPQPTLSPYQPPEKPENTRHPIIPKNNEEKTGGQSELVVSDRQPKEIEGNAHDSCSTSSRSTASFMSAQSSAHNSSEDEREPTTRSPKNKHSQSPKICAPVTAADLEQDSGVEHSNVVEVLSNLASPELHPSDSLTSSVISPSKEPRHISARPSVQKYRIPQRRSTLTGSNGASPLPSSPLLTSVLEHSLSADDQSPILGPAVISKTPGSPLLRSPILDSVSSPAKSGGANSITGSPSQSPIPNPNVSSTSTKRKNSKSKAKKGLMPTPPSPMLLGVSPFLTAVPNQEHQNPVPVAQAAPKTELLINVPSDFDLHQSAPPSLPAQNEQNQTSLPPPLPSLAPLQLLKLTSTTSTAAVEPSSSGETQATQQKVSESKQTRTGNKDAKAASQQATKKSGGKKEQQEPQQQQSGQSPTVTAGGVRAVGGGSTTTTSAPAPKRAGSATTSGGASQNSAKQQAAKPNPAKPQQGQPAKPQSTSPPPPPTPPRGGNVGSNPSSAQSNPGGGKIWEAAVRSALSSALPPRSASSSSSTATSQSPSPPPPLPTLKDQAPPPPPSYMAAVVSGKTKNGNGGNSGRTSRSNSSTSSRSAGVGPTPNDSDGEFSERTPLLAAQFPKDNSPSSFAKPGNAWARPPQISRNSSRSSSSSEGNYATPTAESATNSPRPVDNASSGAPTTSASATLNPPSRRNHKTGITIDRSGDRSGTSPTTLSPVDSSDRELSPTTTANVVPSKGLGVKAASWSDVASAKLPQAPSPLPSPSKKPSAAQKGQKSPPQQTSPTSTQPQPQPSKKGWNLPQQTTPTSSQKTPKSKSGEQNDWFASMGVVSGSKGAPAESGIGSLLKEKRAEVDEKKLEIGLLRSTATSAQPSTSRPTPLQSTSFQEIEMKVFKSSSQATSP